MSSPLWQLILMRLRQPLRQPETIFWTFFFPVLLALALGIAFRRQAPEPVLAAVVIGPGAERLAADLRAVPEVRLEVLDSFAAEQRLRTGRATLIVVPGDPVRYRFDPTRPESRLARVTIDAALQRAAWRAAAVRSVDEPVTTPGGRYIDFLVPGLLGMNIMGGGLWGIGWAMVESRTRRLLRRLLATPMRRRDFLLAHMFARLFFLPLEAVVLLLLAWLLFRVGVAGSVLSLTVVILAGGLSFAGLGTLLACRARTLETMSGLINLCTLPMVLMSGVFFSTSRFPEMLQPVIRLLPLTALIDASRAIMGEGASLVRVGPELAVLLVWGVASTFMALRLFRWT
jgi:ABC-2 type transport system permease protein